METAQQERDRVARRAKLNVLSLTLFELSGKMTQTIRHAGDAGLPMVGHEVAFMKSKIEGWRTKIATKRAQWG